MEKKIEDLGNESNEFISDYNEAVNQIQRIGADLWDARNYAKKGDFDSWKWTLDHYWLELVADARKKAGEDTSKNTYFIKINELNTRIAKASKNRHELYAALQEKEIFLRFLQDDVGKGAKRSPADEDEFD